MTPTHSTEKPTPRTDEYERNGPNDESPSAHAAWAEVLTFARQLERELAATTPTPDAVKLAGKLAEQFITEAAVTAGLAAFLKSVLLRILLPFLTAQQAEHAAVLSRVEDAEGSRDALRVEFDRREGVLNKLRADLSAARAEVDKQGFDLSVAQQHLNAAREYERDRHKFFVAAMEAVGMKGEVGSLAGLERQIVEKIAQLTAQQADHAATVARLERERDALRRQCAVAGIGDHKGDYFEGRCTETGIMRQQLANLRESKASLEADLSAARAELKDQRGINDLAEAECVTLRAQLTAALEYKQEYAKIAERNEKELTAQRERAEVDTKRLDSGRIELRGCVYAGQDLRSAIDAAEGKGEQG